MTPARDTTPVVRCDAVTRRFGATTALRDVSLSLARGEVTGLIGRNGSGKSTLLQHMTGLQLPTSGSVQVFGVPSAQLGASELSRIGTVTQHGRLISWMSVGRLVQHVSGFYATWDHAMVAGLLSRFALDVSARAGALSPGGKQLLQLVLALGYHPELLLLDEPLSDLDPTARRTALEVLMETYARDRPTMVISSHLLHDIEPVITRVLCLDQGRVAADDELDTLKEQHGLNLEQLFPVLTASRPSEQDGRMARELTR